MQDVANVLNKVDLFWNQKSKREEQDSQVTVTEAKRFWSCQGFYSVDTQTW